jgi:hypothetical protein
MAGRKSTFRSLFPNISTRDSSMEPIDVNNIYGFLYNYDGRQCGDIPNPLQSYSVILGGNLVPNKIVPQPYLSPRTNRWSPASAWRSAWWFCRWPPPPRNPASPLRCLGKTRLPDLWGNFQYLGDVIPSTCRKLWQAIQKPAENHQRLNHWAMSNTLWLG